MPVTIQQGGNANDLSVQINVAMLPPVEDFRGYEAAQPGTAHCLMKAADEQRHHRFQIESQIVSRSERRRDIGQIISGALAMTGLIGAIALGLHGSPWVAGLLAIVAVGGPFAAQTMAGMMARAEMQGRGSPPRTVAADQQAPKD